MEKINQNNNDKKNIKKPIIFHYSGYNKETLLERLEQCAKDSDSLLILEMYRVDLNLAKKAYSIVGNRLRIRPIRGQTRKRTGTNDYPYYTYQDILKSEEIINTYIRATDDYLDKDGDIKSLSPLEKFIVAYILTIKFAKYEDDMEKVRRNKQYHEERSVYEIVRRKKNKKMVCVGYVNLLKEFLYRMGITTTAVVGFDPFELLTSTGEVNLGHVRLLIRLIDPKYNVDAVYISDPTQDENGLTQTIIKHMLMSHDESMALNPEYEIDLKSWNGRNKDHYWEIDEDFSETIFPFEKFHIPISQDAIAKAFLAVEHFFDKHMKMVDNNGYDILEYYDTAWRLNLNDIISSEPDEIIYKECLKLPLNEIMCNYGYIAYYFISMFSRKISAKYSRPIILKYDEITKKGTIAVRDEITPASTKFKNKKRISDFEDVDIYEIQDIPLIDQLDYIYKVCDNYQKESSKMGRKNQDNRVK